MAPERWAHSLTKFRIARCLAEAVEREGLACEVAPDGMAVEIDATTTYEPDALVRCGPMLPDHAFKLNDPVIVVEVLSPSMRTQDAGVELIDYFRLAFGPPLLILRTEDGAIIHHARNADDTILTRIIREGPIRLDPPGLAVTDLFPAAG